MVERTFWLSYGKYDPETHSVKFHNSMVVSTSVEDAILEVYGFSPVPASPLKYDVCTQEQGEAGYRYWFAGMRTM